MFFILFSCVNFFTYNCSNLLFVILFWQLLQLFTLFWFYNWFHFVLKYIEECVCLDMFKYFWPSHFKLIYQRKCLQWHWSIFSWLFTKACIVCMSIKLCPDCYIFCCLCWRCSIHEFVFLFFRDILLMETGFLTILVSPLNIFKSKDNK